MLTKYLKSKVEFAELHAYERALNGGLCRSAEVRVKFGQRFPVNRKHANFFLHSSHELDINYLHSLTPLLDVVLEHQSLCGCPSHTSFLWLGLKYIQTHPSLFI